MSADAAARVVAAFTLADGSGNRFLLWDRWDEPAREEADARADEAALAPEASRALGVDGLLTLARPRAGGDLRMVLHNADGGRPEACGNGLRVVACAHTGGRGGAGGAQPLVVETDAGPREAWPLADPDGGLRRARVALGRPRLVASDALLDAPTGRVVAHVVDVGNPHCVVFVADLTRVDVNRLGAALERHPRFPHRTNVEFVERTADGLRLAVWERGVGETASCGTGVVAAAFAARLRDGATGPRRVETRGGLLRVSFRDDGQALLEGPVALRSLQDAERAALDPLARPHGAHPR